MRCQHQPLWIVAAVFWLQVYGLFTIFIGLVGVKKDYLEITPIPSHMDTDQLSVPDAGSIYKSSVEKIALIVIDAMRIDFLSDHTMPFTSAMLDQSLGCFFLSTVKSPTVTLPRIKALVSGDISTYWDIIQNFHSKKISQDNFIWHSVEDSNKKISFYGDDTWITLFPTEFTRSEGTTSFYVTDFEEVDRNVTRHLDEELKGSLDWDMIILHYLGLDHIGHVYGPKSPLVPGKLREMDSVVKDVYHYLSSLGSRSIVIVCGDHGMANIGGHGGNSYHEVTTPLLVLSTERIPNCNQENWRNLEEVPSVQQVDIATTISALWGITLPAASTGKVIWPLFGHLSLPEKLFLAYYNAIHLLKFSDQSETDFGNQLTDIRNHHSTFLQKVTPLNEEGEEILKRYQNLLESMSKLASEQLGEQNGMQMVFGITLCFQSIYLFKLTWDGRFVGFLELIAVLFPVSLSLFEQVSTGTALILQSAILLVQILFQPNVNDPQSQSPWSIYLLQVINYATPLFYFSSSFIEEEQFLWYYLWGAAIMTLIVISPQLPSIDRATTFKILYQIFLILVLHRVGTAWNQTGQKWSHLKDLVDSLRESNLLSVVVPLSVTVLCFNRRRELCKLSVIIISFVTAFKTEVIPSISYLQNPPQLIFVLILAYIILSSLGRRTKPRVVITNVVIFLTLLLQKHENIPLVTIVLLQADALTKVISQLTLRGARWNLTLIGILVSWFSNVVFFYQGNSNSIASIDVNAGYIGLNSYNEVLVGLLVFCNTFSLPMLVVLAYFETNESSSGSSNNEVVSSFFTILAKTNSARVCIYSVVIFSLRHHLFIWSVFAPKLLYLIAQTTLYATITTIYSLARC